jgi:hypothetical protein
MKKNVLFLALILGSATSVAQNVVDFENHTLSTESYDNGSAGNGDFIFGSLHLTNYYDAGWASWNGFAISNKTDNTTGGWGNQYSAYHGAGKSSTNYAIHYPQGTLSLGTTGSIDSFFVSTTAYSAISMRDGDAFAKQFGSPNDADGNPDGTNGEDFLRLWIIGSDEGETQKDSIEFYLADYRFADNNLDYILDDWAMIDLTNFGFEVAEVSFRFESSDVGTWGINTPTYFAIDDIYYSLPASIQEVELSVRCFPNPMTDVLIVQGESGELSVLNASGQIVFEALHEQLSQLSVADLQPGLYFVQLTNERGTFVQKVLK